MLFLILRSWTKQDPIQLSDNLLNVTWLKSVLAYIGFPQAGFSSTDYFPLLPWIFLFATGYFLYSFLQEKGLINRLFGKGKVSGINFLGKHSLIIYMIHQPICYVVAFLVSEIFNIEPLIGGVNKKGNPLLGPPFFNIGKCVYFDYHSL